MSTAAGSTVPRRQLGRYLRQLREEARITVKAAADALEWSAPKIWRIEGGATSMRSLDVEAMCRIYGAPPEMTEALTGLARETKARGWWHSYGDAIPTWFELYVGAGGGREPPAPVRPRADSRTAADRGVRERDPQARQSPAG